MRCWLVVVVLWCCLGGRRGGVDAARPQLVSSSVWFTPNASILNEQIDSMLVQLDFDQPLYTTGHSFLCPLSEYGCPELNCTACDWSGQEPTGCDDTDCCGPAQLGDMTSARAWCSHDGPEYKTLKIGEISERFTLQQGERMYVRFFVPEEYYCRPINIIPRPYYGAPSSAWSTREAYPTFSSQYGWRDSLNAPGFGFGQNSVLICPNTTFNPEYNVGTFSGMLYGAVPTSFEIEINVSPESHPLPEPETRLSCDDVPDEVMEYASIHDQAFCVEDGVTMEFIPTELLTESITLVVPVPKGCHSLTFFSGSQKPCNPVVTHHMYCLQSETFAPRALGNAAAYRVSNEGESFVISACFEEEVTYMFCGIRLYTEEKNYFQFSSVAPVIRKSLLEVPDASLSMQDALQTAWAVNFGRPKYACVDSYSACFDWVVTPSENPLYLYPPPASPDMDGMDIVYEDIQEIYRNAGLQTKKENRLSLTIVFTSKIKALLNDIDTLAIVITGITNADGELVDLPGGGVDQNPPNQLQYSISNFVEHIPLNQIPLFEYPRCDFEKYATYQGLVQEYLDKVATESDLSQVLSDKYSLDAMNTAVLAQSCTAEVADNLGIYRTEIVKRDSVECFPDFGTLAYWLEPCCNPFLITISCCIPFDYNKTTLFYTEEADVSGCGESECAQSYYSELSFSLNHFEDPSLGCTSGITSPARSFAKDLAEAMDNQYINCLELVGFGDQYQGTPCQVDADCEFSPNICYLGLCVLPDLDMFEDQFLSCYIAFMPSSLESYLKRNILPKEVSDLDKNSTEFYLALKEAATVQDCVNPLNPLDIDFRTQYRLLPVDFACTAEFYGFQWPEDAEELFQQCPGKPLLRSTPISFNVSSCEFACFDFQLRYQEATEESCPTRPECNINNLGEDCDGYYCVYCPPGGLPCQEVPNYTNEEDCENAFACELPDGTVIFTLNEDECRAQGLGCSTDCVGDSCESIQNLEGGCFVPSASSSSDCSAYGVANGVVVEWFNDELCALPEMNSQSSCGEFPSVEWETCQQNGLDECDGGTPQQHFLGCYISLWHECSDKDECEQSGRCTDREYYTLVRSEDPVDVQYGVCLATGEYVTEERPSCASTNLFSTIITGCLGFTIENEIDCVKPSVFNWVQWVEPSLTEDECLARQIGKSGCRVKKDPEDFLFWMLDDDECSCNGGVVETAWEWIPGIWRGGVPHSLEWKRAEQREYYDFKNAVSFILLADWITASSEEQFLFPLQSQIICESQSIRNPVNTLVCDCLDDGGEICYDPGELEKEIQMGLSEVCQGESTFVKNPSAQVNFGIFSVSKFCSFLNISLISRNWFSAPFAPPPLSFKWQDQRERGVVINKNEATVGEVLGDGLILAFSAPSVMEEFDVCLRLNTKETGKYKVKDFGFATSSLDVIYPLGLKSIELGDFSDGIWYCSSFDFLNSEARIEDTIYLFPINRQENYEDEENDYTDQTTKALCYTLGALYCLFGLLNLVGLIAYIRDTVTMGKQRLSLPNFCTTLFVILCIFRASFMFLYPSGTFEFEPLAYFVVFEIPTFLLFSTVIFVIYIFKRLIFQNGFFPGNPIQILIIGWTFVWLLWAITVIIYSEVILDDTSSSPCEGRVEKSYDDEEENTRTLAITYQSVIITITLVLTIIFFYYTFLIYTTTENKTPAFTQFVVIVGGSFNIAFFMRSVLFIFMLAFDFASSIYLFCTLFFTEILMMAFLFFQFHQHYFRSFSEALSQSGIKSKTKSKSKSGLGTSSSS